jgi:hypothetical protein
MTRRKIPGHIRARMLADSINQLPILPEGTREREQIKKVRSTLAALYDDTESWK